MRSTFKVLFYVKKGSEKPNGNLPLMCRITVDGEIKQFSCKMDVPLRTTVLRIRVPKRKESTVPLTKSEWR